MSQMGPLFHPAPEIISSDERPLRWVIEVDGIIIQEALHHLYMFPGI